MTEPNDAPPCPCRLCGSDAQPQFSLTVLQKYQVQYYLCTRCKSLQTEAPYWLQEAYSDASSADSQGSASKNLNNLDTGAAQRNLRSLAATMLVAKALKAKNLVDYGGGDGLLCRLLRDYGLNAFVSDPHASPTYAQGFTDPNFEHPDLLTAFEVFEHLPDPATDLAGLFATDPVALLATTSIYSGQGPDWWYLIPETGHHIFFYSEEALKIIADRHGYELLRPGAHILFVKPGRLSATARKFLQVAMREKPLRLYRALVNLYGTVPESLVPTQAT
jgi:hypothetical protein